MNKNINDPNLVTMVDRTCRIMDAIYNSENPMGISYLANLLDLPKATVFRILNTMALWGYVEQDAKSEKYRLGATFIKMGENARRAITVAEIAKPYMSELAESYGETAYLCKLYDNQALIIETVDGEESALYSMVDPVIPLYCSALGRIFLTQYSEEELEKYFSVTNLKPRTISTANTKERVFTEIEKIKQEQISFDCEEYEYGMTCIAGPIYDKEGTIIASLSVSGPTTRIRHKGVEEVTERIKIICETVSNKIKYR